MCFYITSPLLRTVSYSACKMQAIALALVLLFQCYAASSSSVCSGKFRVGDIVEGDITTDAVVEWQQYNQTTLEVTLSAHVTKPSWIGLGVTTDLNQAVRL